MYCWSNFCFQMSAVKILYLNLRTTILNFTPHFQKIFKQSILARAIDICGRELKSSSGKSSVETERKYIRSSLRVKSSGLEGVFLNFSWITRSSRSGVGRTLVKIKIFIAILSSLLILVWSKQIFYILIDWFLYTFHSTLYLSRRLVFRI